MNNNTTNSEIERWEQKFPAIDISHLPARMSKRLWVSPEALIELLDALRLADWAVSQQQAWFGVLVDGQRRGPKPRYRDSSILVMALLQVAWQLSYEEIVDYLRSHPGCAQAVGFAPGQVISVGQYWVRRRALGAFCFWLFFLALVWQLVRMGVILGQDVILDGSTLRAWFHDDAQADWSFPKPGKGSVWGYKVHTLLCRWSDLPIMFLVTPANRQELVFAMPLLTLAVAAFGFTFTIVRADAGYFVYPILHFIRTVLKASFIVDYNLRRKGKRFLATLDFLRQWRFHLRPRSAIERHFAWAKRYFALEPIPASGLIAAYQHVALVYSTMLAVALIAHRFQRPELARSRSRVLALKSLS